MPALTKLGQEPPEFYAALDPGIRDVVRYLRRNGFVTTDSGDGVSKFKQEWREPGALAAVLPFPHVAVHGEVWGMVGHARMLRRRLEIGADEGRLPPGGRVQLTYDPADDSVVLLVSWPAPA